MYITAAVGESPIRDRWGVATLPISNASLAQRLPIRRVVRVVYGAGLLNPWAHCTP